MTDRLRYLLDNAAGTAFLPPAWQELADALPKLLDVVEAARELDAALNPNTRPDYQRHVTARAGLHAAIAALDAKPTP